MSGSQPSWPTVCAAIPSARRDALDRLASQQGVTRAALISRYILEGMQADGLKVDVAEPRKKSEKWS